MAEKLTEELLNELIFTGSIEAFLEKELPEKKITLDEYLCLQIEKRGIKRSTVIKKAKLNTTFGYQLFSGERNAGKDTLLQLAFAMDMNLRETQRLLKIGGAGELYCKNRREAIVIYAITKGKTLTQADDLLFHFGEKTICEA